MEYGDEVHPPPTQTPVPPQDDANGVDGLVVSEYDESVTESDSSDSGDDQPLAKFARQGRGIRTRGGVRGRGVRGRGVRGRGVRGRGVRGQQPNNQQVGGGGQNRGRGNARQPRPPLSNWKIADDNDTPLEEFDFNEIEGLNVRLPNNATCLDYLELYLTEEILKSIVTETNRFSKQFFETTAQTSYTELWQPVDVPEMKVFFGLCILMGIVHKPSLPMYWSKDELFSTPIFSKVMRRDRFYLILKFLHFNDNEDPTYDKDDENRDRLHKLRPFVDKLRERFQKVYTPGPNLSVDESLVLFKGRLHFKQFIRTKRARFGIKLSSFVPQME